jgi:hypothetical protein
MCLALFLVAHENTYKWYVSNYVIPNDQIKMVRLEQREGLDAVGSPNNVMFVQAQQEVYGVTHRALIVNQQNALSQKCAAIRHHG